MALVLSPAVPAAGEEVSDFEDLDLEQLLNTVYTAAKHEQDIAESPSAITVIDREQIENTPCTDVICLLRQVPEVDVLFLTPMYAAVGARALTDDSSNKVLVLIDGQEINLEAMGVPWWQAMTIHMDDIERIEVIRGPGSALYGANAHSMVVTILTRKPKKNTAEVFLGGGEYDRSSLHLGLNRLFGDFSLRIGGGLDTESEWLPLAPRERDTKRLRLRLIHEVNQKYSELQFGLVNTEGTIYSVFGRAKIRDAWLGEAALFHKQDFFQVRAWYAFYTGDIAGGQRLVFQGTQVGRLPPRIPFFSHTLDVEPQISWSPFEGNLLLSGVNLRWIRVESDEIHPAQIDQLRIGALLQDEQRLGENLVLTGGVRFDYNSITPFTLSPRLAAVWQFTEEQFLRLAVGQAFRKPSVFETSLHVSGLKAEPGFEEVNEFLRTNLGNEDLENESVTAVEAGYHGRFWDSRLSVAVDIFYNRYRNTVNFSTNFVVNELGMPDLTRSEAKYLNEGREADSLGGSLSITFRALGSFRFNANYTFRHSWYIEDFAGDASSLPVSAGDRVAWEPAHRFNLSLYHLSRSGFRTGINLHAFSASDWVMESDIFGYPHPVYTPASCTLNPFAAWRLTAGTSEIELGIRAFNLLDSNYYDIAQTETTGPDPLGGFRLRRRIFLFVRGSL